MKDIIGRSLKPGDFVLRLALNSINAYAIVVGENELASCKFILDEKTNVISVYENSYHLSKVKNDTPIYKLNKFNSVETAIYNTIKEFRDEELNNKLKSKENDKKLSESLKSGDIITISYSNKNSVYLYFGEGSISSFSSYQSLEDNEEFVGHIYLELNEYSLNNLLLDDNLFQNGLSSLDEIAKYIKIQYKKNAYYPYYLPYRCTNRKIKPILKINGHLVLNKNNYDYIYYNKKYNFKLNQ